MPILRPDLDLIARALHLPVTMRESDLLKSWALRCPDEAYPTVESDFFLEDSVIPNARRIIGFATHQDGRVQIIYACTTTVRCEDGSVRVFDVMECGKFIDVPNVVANVFYLAWCELRDRALGYNK